MAWNKALPSTTEKLRTLSGVITSNWAAIEEGDETSGTPIFQRAILLGDRDVIASASDPVVVGATTYLYSKKDGGGVQELYTRDAASNTPVQLTNGGKLGSTGTDLEADSISFDGTVTYDETMLPRAWGLIASGGASLLINKNLTGVSNNSTGNYTVDITGLGFALATDYTVFLTGGSSVNRIASVTTKTATTFVVRITNDNGNASDAECSVMVMMA